MKALILAAGFGMRLLPYSKTTPKCLFPIADRPLLDIIIRNLQKAGSSKLIINTHHLAQKIESFIASQNYTIPVYTRHEPDLLGTGGAIKNVADFWDDKPFMVVNSDIVTDFPLKAVYDFHINHNFAATLVLYDDEEFNTVSVDKNGFIISFDEDLNLLTAETKKLAFTGIQVLDPEVLDLIPDNRFSSSIEMYKKLLSSGKKIKAFISPKHIWKDIGTPDRYRQTVIDKMASVAFQRAFCDYGGDLIERTLLSGDGSDRKWYRLAAGPHTLIMADHGIRTKSTQSEIDSFVAIGRHLYNTGIPVPKIYLFDTFCGLVFLEDLGDSNLQAVIRSSGNRNTIISSYSAVINILVKMSVLGAINFDRSWTYQTRDYNRKLILEKECRYFVDAFLNGYLLMDSCFEDFEDEFTTLADNALRYTTYGFMHRDLQSRNIMVKGNKYYLIDFQGGRIGPIQYDLAALLMDPYVELPITIQDRLVDYCIEMLSAHGHVDRNNFFRCYRYCSITRNLQILGAFGHLSRQKGKTYFAKYIPVAVKTLQYNLNAVPSEEFSHLKETVAKL
ncbi:sugar phosphate nucleotidyltransferase [Thermodesulfobacteriota bacterium]